MKNYFTLWSIVAIIQVFDNSLLIFWRNRATIGGGRGSISFATEPAYFVFFLILSSSILYSINPKNKYYFLISLLFSVILAKSFIGMLFLLIIIIIVYLGKKNIIKIIIIGIIGIIAIPTLVSFIPVDTEYRFLRLMKSILNNPKLLLLKDGSAKTRIFHIVFSLKGSLENIMFPNGFSSWGEYAKLSLIKYKENFLLNQSEIIELMERKIPNNINTMFGGMLYELGILGLIFYCFIYKICMNKKIWLIILVLSIDGLNITNPYFGILLGINYFLYKNKQIKKVRGNLNEI